MFRALSPCPAVGTRVDVDEEWGPLWASLVPLCTPALSLMQRCERRATQDAPPRPSSSRVPTRLSSFMTHVACHSERSEESTSLPVTVPARRFFAALRMTGEKVKALKRLQTCSAMRVILYPP